MVFLCRNFTAGGKKFYLWQWLLSADLQGDWNILFWNFDGCEVFYIEINFAINVYGNMLIENYVCMIAVNHINTKTFHENVDAF